MVYDELILNFIEEQFVYYVVRAIFRKGLIYEGMEKFQDEIKAYNLIIEEYSDIKTQNVRNIVATSYLKKATTMFKENTDIIESLEVLDTFKLEFCNDSHPKIQHFICLSLYIKSIILNSKNLLDRELEVYNEMLILFGESEELNIKETVAKSLKNKGETLTKLQRHNEALDTFDEITKRYTDDDESSLKELAANAMMNKGRYLHNIGNHSEAIKMYEKIHKYYSQSDQISDTVQLKKADTYVAMGNFNEAVTVYDEIISTVEKLNNSNVDLFAQSYLGKVFALAKAEKYESSNTVIDTFIEKVQKIKEIKVKRYVAFALSNKALNFTNLEDDSNALNIYKEIIMKFKNFGKDKILNEIIQSSFYKKALTVGRLGDESKSVKELNSLYIKLKDETEYDLRIIAKKSLLSRAIGLCNLERYEESLMTHDLIESTYYSDTELHEESFEYSFKINKSDCLRGLGKLKEALELFLDIKQLIGTMSQDYFASILGEINSIGFEAYTTKQYELSKNAFMLAFNCGSEISGSNLSFMVRRGEVTGNNVPSHEVLLAPALKNNEPFAIINKLLLNIMETNSEECKNLIEKIDDFTGILHWWSQLAINDDPEGHLVIGLLTRANLVSDPNGMSFKERFDIVDISGMGIPSWLNE